MSSKRPEKASLDWRPWDDPSVSFFNLSYKCIFIALFLVLLYQICA